MPRSPSSASTASSAVRSHDFGAAESIGALAAPAFSPLYQQIKTLILGSLQAREWQPGEAIPSEQELASRFRVSQGTVRKAIDELAADNLVVRRQGKGTFVATHAEQQVEYRFLKLLPDHGDPSSEGPAERNIIECRRVSASTGVAAALALTRGAPVLQVRRVLSFARMATILEDLWLPADPFQGLTLQRLSDYDGPMYALFETEFGIRMVRAREKLRAVVADAAEASLLDSRIGTPLLSIERIAYTYNDVPMELRHGRYRTDTHHYYNELS